MTRAGAEIGRGLEPARPARAIGKGERVHVLGVAGAGASAAALLAHHAGAAVSGCDPGGPSPYTAALEAAGVALDWRHAPEHVTGGAPPARLAVTKALTAVDPDHPELRAARRRGIPAEPWQQLVADAADSAGQKLVAVAGTHGKSTTTGWLVHLLVNDGRDPSAFVGALLAPELSGGLPATARWGGGDVCVVEADEYAGNFDPYRPAVAVLLNAEWDHPDVFADEQAVADAFAGWLRRASEGGSSPTLIANAGDAGVRRVLDQLTDWPGALITFRLEGRDGRPGDGQGPPGDAGSDDAPTLVASTEAMAGGGSRFHVRREDDTAGDYVIGLPGRHNAENALAVIGAAMALGVSEAAMSRSLAAFGGVGRRLELKGEIGGVAVLDDYAHHPTAISRTLQAVRDTYPSRRVWAVYEPLTYHRTAHMLDGFARALASADAVLIADIWAGRDPDTSVTSSAELAAAVAESGGAPARATGSVEATADCLAAEVRPGDVVLVMGGGRSYVIAERLLAQLRGDLPAGGPEGAGR